MPQVLVRRPLDELEFADQHWLQAQCRMQDYAAFGIGDVVLIAFGGSFVRHDRSSFFQCTKEPSRGDRLALGILHGANAPRCDHLEALVHQRGSSF